MTRQGSASERRSDLRARSGTTRGIRCARCRVALALDGAPRTQVDAAITNRIAFDSSSDFLQRPRLGCRRRMRCAQHWSGAYPPFTRPQRFGRGMNFCGPDVGQKRCALASEEISADSRFAARSLLFNEVVAHARVGTVDRCMDGDVSEASLPTIPCGVVAPPMAQAVTERAALNHGPPGKCAGARRFDSGAASAAEAGSTVEVVDDTVILAFTLAPGAFATALLFAGALADERHGRRPTPPHERS